MASVVDICNQALGHIGEAQISALDEGSTQSIWCNLYYEQVRDEVLTDFAWTFAEARQQLAELTADTTVWQYRYALPSDCLRALFIEELGRVRPIWDGTLRMATRPVEPYEFIVRGDDVLTDVEDAVLIYTSKVTDPNKFPPTFVEALSFKLAGRVCLPITGDENKRMRVEQLYQEAIGRAEAVDGSTGYRDHSRDPKWIAARQ